MPAPRTSELLATLVAARSTTHADVLGAMTVGDLMAALRNRAFGLSLILFGIPNLVPIPGLPILCGLVLAILSAQIIIGRDTLWLPGRIASQELPRTRLQRLIARLQPLLRRIETVARPRFALAAGPTFRRIVGCLVFLLAVELIVVPVPWIGSMPQGLAITFLGFGLAERDGVFVAAGMVLSGIAMSIGAGIAYVVWSGAGLLF